MIIRRENSKLSSVVVFAYGLLFVMGSILAEEPVQKPLSWMADSQKSMPQYAWRKLPAVVRPLIGAPKEHLKMHAKFMEIKDIESADPVVGLLVKSHGGREELESAGAKVGAQIGDIFSVRIPIGRLKELAGLSKVISIQPAMIHRHHLDASIPECRADDVHQGDYATIPPTFSGYTGKGVLVGALDTGIDWNHEDFINDGDGSSRILYIWDQTITATGDEKPPANFDYGVEYSKTQIDKELDGTTVGAIHTKDDIGHGTHVMGIIAGDGSATGGPLPVYTYVGMAPEADILMVRGANEASGDWGFSETEELDAISYAATKADVLGKPLSFNMSLGGQWGPHDGTGLVEQAIDYIVGTGKVIVISAGNEGTDVAHAEYIHAEGTVSTGTETTITFEVPSSYNYGSGNDFVILTLWYQGNDKNRVTVTSPDGFSWYADTGSDRDGYATLTSDGAIYIDNSYSGVDPNNGDRECYIQIWDYYSYYPPEYGTWRITVKGNTILEGGHFDSWIPVSQIGFDYAYFSSTSGSNEENVGSPGVADKAITVGAYSTKTSWIAYTGSSQSYSGAVLNDHAYFSSVGPTRDDPGHVTGRLKPEISGSGFGVISALSEDAADYMTSPKRNQDYVHVMMSGTSMSAPHVAGCVALMLQKNPTLTSDQVKQILQNSARSDLYTGTVPNYNWGYGKMDAYAAVQNTPASPQYFVNLTPARKEIGGAKGSTAVCPIFIRNIGQNSDSYTLSVTGHHWTTALWDSGGTAQITAVNNIPVGSFYKVLVKVNIPSSSSKGAMDSVVVKAVSSGNPSQFGSAKVVTTSLGSGGTLPWSDNFPSTSLNSTKWVYNVGPATSNSSGMNEPSASYSLNLNGNTDGGDEIRSQAIDLSGYTRVALGYYYQRTGNGDSPEDGDDLFVSYFNNAGDWIYLKIYPGNGPDMSSYTYDQVLLPEDAYHTNFQIRFHVMADYDSYDPDYTDFDDWFLDDVMLKLFPSISVEPDSFYVPINANATTTRSLTLSNNGEGDLTFTISTRYTGSSGISSLSPSLSSIHRSRAFLPKFSLQEAKQRTYEKKSFRKVNYQKINKSQNLPLSVQSGNVIYVDVNSTSPIEDGSLENPYKTITDGVLNATEGDTIIVAQGIYYEDQIFIDIGITLKGNGAIIYGTGLDNLSEAFGILCGNVTIMNFIITNCEWGIFIFGGEGGPITIINNTIYNHSNSGIVVWPLPGDVVTVMNNIIAFAGTFGISYWEGTLYDSYNDVYGHLSDWDNCTPGIGSISLDPLFVNTEGNDFTLQTGSPCIDAGNPDSRYNDRNATRNDMGAFGGPEIGGPSVVGGWLSYDITSGTVFSGASQNITLTFNSQNLNPNTLYHANTIISSNDLENTLIDVPVHLAVSVAPYYVTVDPEEQSATAALGDTAVYAFTISNLGSSSDSYTLSVSGNGWPIEFWNAMQTSKISSIGPLASGGSVDIAVLVIVPGTAMDGQTDTGTITATSAGDPTVSDFATVTTTAGDILPWFEDFPSTVLDTGKWTVISGAPSVNTEGENEQSAPYSLELKGGTSSGDAVETKPIDLSGYDNVVLSYYYQNDETETDDDLVVKCYDGTYWVQLFRHDGNDSEPATFLQKRVKIPSFACQSNFKIKFESKANSSSDEWFIDDVLISVPPKIEISPNEFEVTVDLGDSTTRTLTIGNGGSSDLNWAISIKNSMTSTNLYFNDHFENNQCKESNNVHFNDANCDSIIDSRNITGSTVINEIIMPLSVGDIIHYIPSPGTNAEGLTWDGENLWNSDINSNIIYKLNPIDGSILAQISSITCDVAGLAWDGSYLWASCDDNNMIYKLDPNNGTIIRSFSFPGGWAHGITWAGQNLWINDFDTKFIYKVDPSTGAVLTSIPAPGDKSIGLTWDGQYLWVGDFGTNLLYQIDPSDGTIIQTVASPANNPRDLAWDGKYLWIAFSPYSVNRIYQIDVGHVERNWLSFVPAYGTLIPGGTQNVELTFRTADLKADTTYSCNLVIASNDPSNSELQIPVDMIVAGLDYCFSLSSDMINQDGFPAQTLESSCTLTNSGQNADSYGIAVSGNRWPTTVWDESGTSQITEIPSVASGGSYTFVTKVQIPSSVSIGKSDTAEVQITSAGNNTMQRALKIYTSTGWNEKFETTTLNDSKWTVISGSPVINSEGENEPSPPYALELNSAAILESKTINLGGFSEREIYLAFWWQNRGTDTGDDLVIKVFDGTYWIEIYGIPGETTEETTFAQCSLKLPSYVLNEYFKFQFIVECDYSSEKWFIDDVSIYDLSDVESETAAEPPSIFGLDQNYPNPFNPATTISYALPRPSHVKIQIFNTQGRLIATLIDGKKAAGRYTAQWNGRDMNGQTVASGVYFYRIVADGFVKVKKLMLLK